MIHVLGNLACELEWRGAPAPPTHVATRIAALATLMRGLVDADAVTVWTPVAVDPARVPAIAGLPGAVLAVGTPPPGAPVLAWGASAALAAAAPIPSGAISAALEPALRRALAEPPPDVAVARAVNDRRLAHELARELGCALPGAAVATTLDAALAATTGAAAASPTGEWIAKLALTSAGRDRIRGGVPIDPATRARLDRLLRDGAVVIEPWLARRVDIGTTGAITAGGVDAFAPHTLITDPRGGFRGIDLSPPAADLDRLREVARAVGRALATRGHRGVFTVDAFVDAAGALHPLIEINARLSFGVVARALCARLGGTGLGVGTAPPPDARILVAPSSADPSAAWVAGHGAVDKRDSVPT